MTTDSIFQLSNSMALLGWIVLLIASPFWISFDKLLIGIIVTIFALTYLWLLPQNFTFSDMEKFKTLDGVMQLFTSKTAVTAGWLHFLAFDLMAGIWIKKNAALHGIQHWMLLPCFFFTFMFGPVGVLLYLLIRYVHTKQFFADNY